MRFILLVGSALMLSAASPGRHVPARVRLPTRTGPGWLVLEGGGKLRNTEVLHRFLELAGANAHLVVIPTAGLKSLGKEFTPAESLAAERWFRDAFGIQHVVAISTTDHKR